MTRSKHRDPNLRTFGIVWVLLAPLLFVMAAISTVRSDVTYYVQLAAFSLVAVAGLILGVAGICRLGWAASGLRILSILGATYFFGTALLVLVWPLVPGSQAEFRVALLLGLAIAPFGVPFLMMARSLTSIVKRQFGQASLESK